MLAVLFVLGILQNMVFKNPEICIADVTIGILVCVVILNSV